MWPVLQNTDKVSAVLQCGATSPRPCSSQHTISHLHFRTWPTLHPKICFKLKIKRYVGSSRLDNIYLCFMICAQLGLRDHWKYIEEGIIFYRKKSPSTADFFLGLRRLHLQWPPPLLEKIGRNEENYKNWLWLNPITTLYSLQQLPTACKGVLNCPRVL